MHYDTSEGKTRIELARRQDGKAARVKLGLFANVAETIDLRGSADRLAILTVLSCLTEATSRRAGVELPQYVDRILKGGQARRVPFQQPTKFDLVINFKTASRARRELRRRASHAGARDLDIPGPAAEFLESQPREATGSAS